MAKAAKFNVECWRLMVPKCRMWEIAAKTNAEGGKFS